MKLFLLTIMLHLLCCLLQGQVRKKLSSAIDETESLVIKWRQEIHQYPELSNREFKTARMVADHLKNLGFEVKEGVARTGVVGLLRGGKPGPCIALRADMDALPVTEEADIPFRSTVKTIYNGQETGVMHACGHDAHVAILLGVAEVLSKFRNEIKGSIKFIFQPAEEGPPEGEDGGASLMVAEGVMENPVVDAIFGLHIQSAIESGTIEYKSGPFMAATDFFSIRIKGKPSHGSQPWLGIDPITTAAQIINSLQTIVSRESELTKAPVVVTVGKITGGVRHNIISEECLMLGTIRTLDQEMKVRVHQRFHHIIQKICEATGATAEVKIDETTALTYNDPPLVKRMLPSLQTAIGTANVKERNWVTGGEDFSYFGSKAPSFFFYLGGMPKGKDPKLAPPHHTSKFFIDDAALKTGMQAFCQLVIDYLQIK